MSTPEQFKRLNGEIDRRVKKIEMADDTASFTELVKLAELDPKSDFRFAKWPEADFRNCDLSGFDFSGADLTNCTFEGTKIKNARFDLARINGANIRSAIDWGEHVQSWTRNSVHLSADHLSYFSLFQDAPFAPEMIKIPPGKLLMGSIDRKGYKSERPQHEVIIEYPLAVGRFAVTFNEWDYYASQKKGVHKPSGERWGRGNRPVINVSWDDAQGYVKWLSETTGQPYRLLSEAEWEYVARAGTDTEFWWGNEISTDQANYHGDYTFGNGVKGEYRKKTVPVDSFEPNPWGLYNVHGNVWEWCEDWWHENYSYAPTDSSAWLAVDGGDSEHRVLRGGSWGNSPQFLRARDRNGNTRDIRNRNFGFRVSRALASN